jgi:hypothetical protein
MSSTSNQGAPSLQALGQQYQNMRKAPSHFGADGGQDFNPEVDAYDSPKHKIMQQLGDLLGDGTKSGADVLQTMGEADEITADLSQPFQSPSFMPGPVIPEGASGKEGAEEADTIYMLYYWRGRHDFLWFKLRQSDEKVVKHGWFKTNE